MAKARTKSKPRRKAAAVGLSRDLLARNPLITPMAAAHLRDLKEHAHAPKWNYVCGDRIGPEDLSAIAQFREELFARRKAPPKEVPPPKVIGRLAAVIPRSEWLRARVASNVDLERDWPRLPTMTREDLCREMGAIMPDDTDMAQVWCYPTSGTTGHIVDVPNSARAVNCYLPLLERAMAFHGVSPEFREGEAGAFLLCAQQKTIAYASVHAVWDNSGYAKLNLRLPEWPTAESPHRYLEAFQPPVLAGDPVSFAEMLRLGIPARPQVAISTALSLAPALRKKIEQACGCPVIDTYSANETGLIAYACRKGFFHVLPHDLYVEVLDAAGRPLPDGQRGEIAVSGGRNPFLPLLRYRTGDWARMERKPCACGDPMPRLLGFEGRAPVLFRAADGSVVNNVDLSRVMRRYPVVQWRFVQRKNGSCELAVRPITGIVHARFDALDRDLHELLGKIALKIRFDAKLGQTARGGKVLPYESELRLAE